MFRDQSPAVHVPDLVDLRSRIAHRFGYRTEATQVRFRELCGDAGGNAEALGRALKREIDKVNEVVKNAGIEPQ